MASEGVWRFGSVCWFAKSFNRRIFAFGEDSLALRLVSELPDLRAAMTVAMASHCVKNLQANFPTSILRLWAQNSFEELPQPTQKGTRTRARFRN